MAFVSFHDYFPARAERETRSITILQQEQLGLPKGHYSFIEMFCDEADCDCRRVFFYVVSSSRKNLEAVVAWGWEDVEFYAKWMGDDDPDLIADLKGPNLNPGSPQTALAPALLKLVETVLLNDADYVERVKEHYTMFRKKVDSVPLIMRKRKKKKKFRR